MFRGSQRNGKAVFTDWSDAHAGYWLFDPANPDEVTNILEGTKDSDGCYTIDGVAIGGGGTGISFYGEGDDEKCYVFCEDYPQGNGNKLIRYDIAGAETFNQPPVFTWANSGWMANQNVSVQADEDGVWVSQARGSGNNAATCPCFLYMDHEGNVLYNSGRDEALASLGAGPGLAINPEKTILAVANYGDGSVNIFSVEWDGNTPAITMLYNIAATHIRTDDCIIQLQFDPAGNLLAHQKGVGLQQFSLINPAPSATTPAKKALLIKGTSTGIENVATDKVDANGPVEYYNLQGVRVENPAAGTIVIRRQGNTATKILVK